MGSFLLKFSKKKIPPQKFSYKLWENFQNSYSIERLWLAACRYDKNQLTVWYFSGKKTWIQFLKMVSYTQIDTFVQWSVFGHSTYFTRRL